MTIHRDVLIPTATGAAHLVEVTLAPNPDAREAAYWQAVIKVNGKPWQVAYPPRVYKSEAEVTQWTEEFLSGVRTRWKDGDQCGS